jgi:hypothetical protein
LDRKEAEEEEEEEKEQELEQRIVLKIHNYPLAAIRRPQARHVRAREIYIYIYSGLQSSERESESDQGRQTSLSSFIERERESMTIIKFTACCDRRQPACMLLADATLETAV